MLFVVSLSLEETQTLNEEKSMDMMSKDSPNSRLAYKTLVSLKSQKLNVDGYSYYLTPGMRVSAEIRLGIRSVLEYLLSPIQGAFHEAGREH
jgi:hemolysin D